MLTNFENLMIERLSELNDGQKDYLEGRYKQFRNKLCREVYRYIAATEPCLSDHSEDHIVNVLENAEALLGDEIKNISPLEHYLLCTSILFHDVGNVYGRNDHHKRISEIYQQVAGNETDRQEQQCIQAIAGAHTGNNKEGDKDTLKPLKNDERGFKSKPIRLVELAAILRMADELAEGPQRTSLFAQENNIFSSQPQSAIFHKYASSTDITIDRKRGSIILCYHIDIKKDGDKILAFDIDLIDFLRFLLKRVSKLNTERKFTSYYSEYLKVFGRVSIAMNAYYMNETHQISRNNSELNDLVVPGEDDQDQLNNMGWNPEDILKEIENRF